MEEREKDIQELCKQVLEMRIEQTGDSGAGGQCPICLSGCSWNDDISDVNHDLDCAYLIAKDLTTKQQ